MLQQMGSPCILAAHTLALSEARHVALVTPHVLIVWPLWASGATRIQSRTVVEEPLRTQEFGVRLSGGSRPTQLEGVRLEASNDVYSIH